MKFGFGQSIGFIIPLSGIQASDSSHVYKLLTPNEARGEKPDISS